MNLMSGDMVIQRSGRRWLRINDSVLGAFVGKAKRNCINMVIARLQYNEFERCSLFLLIDEQGCLFEAFETSLDKVDDL